MLLINRKAKFFFYLASTIVYTLIVSGILILLDGKINFTNPLAIILVVFSIAATLPIFLWFNFRFISHLSSSDTVGLVQYEQDFWIFLNQVEEAQEILKRLHDIVTEIYQPASLLIYTYYPGDGEYGLFDHEIKEAGEGVRFLVDSFLVKELAKVDIFEPFQTGLDPECEDQARIDLLTSRLIIPIKSFDHLAGWLAIGEPKMKESLDRKSTEFLVKICAQAGMALHRVRAKEEQQRIEKELNVLTRVAQGISFTVEFDDILELITSQAGQILPADDFRITLNQASSGLYFHVFVVQQDERLREFENKPLEREAGLEIEVIQSQRPIITDDYEKECRERGQAIADEGIYAWMGIPLNAGAETIGVFSIASRDANVRFNHEQQILLQAIADLTAGAIVKSRLLEESQHRANQLAKLNEIGLELTSTLELKPLFMKVIQNSAKILQSQTGYLLMIDPSSAELVLEAGYGPIRADQVGKRISREADLFGQTVLDGVAKTYPSIQNQSLPGDDSLLEDGSEFRCALAVPMRIQDRVIGAVVVINKCDGTLFDQSDQEWLTVFTNQATIAIENARLYTLTDRALAERVDELSVMQQIDRQLNASLEVESALQITLDWALKQTKTEAGLVGIFEDQNLHVINSRGYSCVDADESNRTKQSPDDKLIKFPVVQSVLVTGQAQVVGKPDDQIKVSNGLLEGVKSQAVIPIKRETQVIGLLLLESCLHQAFSDEMLSFLSRLSDHAAIALANARLFNEVKEANISKSRFVSFVAHELKNPMSSIKGYTELVASGMAGPVTEMQASFLATVRSNVDRMNTIVSDLNDLTKIQVGNLRLECTSVSLFETLNEVTRSLQRQFEEKEQALTLEVPENLPFVWADVSRITQILTNLISNATKYTQSGGAIFIGAESMPALDPSSSGQVHVWVQDHGIGISLDDQKKIFQQYFRTDAAKEMASGTGLGLNITRSLVELQGGSIWFESEPGIGTTFHFTIPTSQPN